MSGWPVMSPSDEATFVLQWLSDKSAIATGRELLVQGKEKLATLLDQLNTADRFFAEKDDDPRPVETRLIEHDGSYVMWSKEPMS